MKTLIYKIESDKDDEIKVKLPDNISWELRFYCDLCETEITEDQVNCHKCEVKI